MNQSTQLANRFREVILNGTWIANTNFKDQLVDSDWQIVTKKVDSLNTIAALAQHIHYYISGILNVFNGGTLDIKDQFSFDFSPVESQEQWNLFLNRFWNDAEEFIRKVETMSDDKLNSVFVDEKYGTYRRNIEAMIEHSYYHLGQIVLIKKMLSQNKQD
ncbi:DUF1572 family protein [Flavobacterium sp. CBA20B-1]|uniref:DUF1572 family protein n=1 Tax=unclassified Flavobacterium TaxID=196869 RepID=UPI00222543E7|nr:MULTISPECIES: DUF1572 family protein [unclassified Flavobacterium]WCM42002.1 DUF1572 family protein [Flavobacterium sp. CBA20B-1]